MNFRAVEAKIRKSTFVESIPLLATSFVLIFFVSLLVCTVAADKVAESMAMGLMYSALVSIIPFTLALKYSLRHVVEGRRYFLSYL